MPLNACGCHIDPSGLYVIVKVPAFTNQNAANLMDNQNQSMYTHFGANERDLTRNTILMYEIGTGLPAAEINSVFQITEVKFSHDGKYLTLGSSSGAISVWAIGPHIHQNMKQVIEAMQLQNDFWFNYPIFLPDYEVFNQPQTLITHSNEESKMQSQRLSGGGQLDNTMVRPPQYKKMNQQRASHSNQFNQV